MIGLDSYSRQVFIYLDPILIYISLWIDCLFEIRKIAVFPLAFIAGWLQGHWWGFISWNYVVWPTFLLMNVFIALKGSHFWFLFHGPLILPYILKTIWYMNTILWCDESAWHNIWPQNKCRSLWRIFNGPVTLPYILKTVWCINIILQDYESVWPDIWPQNKLSSEFAWYLEAYLIYEYHSLGLWVSMTPCST